MSRPPVAGVLCLLAATVPAQSTRWISHPDARTPTDGRSYRPSTSADGGVVAFVSEATNLVPGDTNGVADVFVYSRLTRRVSRISVGPGGVQADGRSDLPHVSAGGRFVAFESMATNLVAGDSNRVMDVFVHDLQLGKTVRVNVSSKGAQAASGPNDFSYPALSADGRHVVFGCDASNLVTGDRNGARDVFAHDRDPDGNGVFDEGNGTTVRLSLNLSGAGASGGSWFPRIAESGRFVTFHSRAPDIVAADTNNDWDVFLHDRDPDGNGRFDEGNGVTTRESVGTGGTQALGQSRDGSPSADGRHVVFFSLAANLVPGDTNRVGDVFVRDRLRGTTVRVSEATGGAQGNGESSVPEISADGRLVSFRSDGSSLVANDTNGRRDLFVRDRDPDGNRVYDEGNGTTERESLDYLDRQTDGDIGFARISRDGRYLVLASTATNLGSPDTSGREQVYQRDRIRLRMRGVAASGQPFGFDLMRAVGVPRRSFLVAFTCSGAVPGIRFHRDLLVPLNYDACTAASLLWAGILQGPIGAGGAGRTADLILPSVPPSLALDAVAVVFDLQGILATTAPLRFVTR